MLTRRSFMAGMAALAAGAGAIQWNRSRLHQAAQILPAGFEDRGTNHFYVTTDAPFINYQAYEQSGYLLRGPDPGPLADKGYISFVGAAQTFGRFAERPFPMVLGTALKAPVLNLGFGGAGPEFFSSNAGFLDLINRSRFLVLQVMAARSAGNSVMLNTSGTRALSYKGESVKADEAWSDAIADHSLGTTRFWELVDETRADWLNEFDKLLGQVQVPVVLLYLGADAPTCQEDRSTKPASLSALMRGHPQMVTRSMVDALAAKCARHVQSVTDYGWPQILTAREPDEHGKPRRRVNKYYPSPEMHLQAARKLFPVCRELWSA